MKRRDTTRIWLACGAAAALLAAGGCKSSAERRVAGPPPIRSTEPTETQAVRLDEARAMRDSGDLDGAMSIFQGILAENPTIATAYLGIGDIYIVRQDWRRAEPAFERAARLEPRNFDAQYGHGLALQMLERFPDAIRAYRRALTLQPDSAEANLNLATSFLQIEDAPRALPYAEAAVRIDPESGAARANLGAIQEELGRYAEAIDTYLAALELMGNHPPLMINLINALAHEKRYQEAVNAAETLVRIAPSANGWERLAWCSFKLRDFDRSIEAYREAVAIDPDHWPSLNGLGVNALNAWLLSKRTDEDARIEARDAFRRSLRVNPKQQKVIDLMLNYKL